MNKRFCPSCGAETVEGRAFCGDCGCPIRTGGWEMAPAARPGTTVVVQQQSPQWNRTAAVVFSAIVPGLGHLYRGKFWPAVGWFVTTGIGYAFICPGILLHTFCVISASSGNVYEK